MATRSLVAGGILLLAAGLASAANNPFAGTWKIDDSKSSWSNGQFPSNMSLMIQLSFSGDEIAYHSLNDTDKQKPAGLDYRVKMDGKPHPLPGSPRFNQVSVRRLSPREMEILEMKDGDVIVGAVYELLAGGRHFVRRGIAKGADGKSHEYEEFFDKQ
ncbi:MAG TPA: hypothetical protein VGS20_16875 [Candidatus Acidoferrales bacterium]|nr:hypothetical protein [Candidatus Acidoferrales bacterium]